MIGLVAIQAMAQDPKPAPTTVPPAAAHTVMPTAPAVPEMPDMDSVSYAIGMSWGNTLKHNAPNANIDTIAKGMKDTVSNATPRFTEAEAQKIIRNYQIAYRTQAAEKNKAEGEAFLAKNATEAGVVKLPSGLQYSVITEGTGPLPAATDTVMVNYRGTLINGTEFDSSYKRNQPFAATLSGGIIKGWSEALQLMKTGSKWKVVIPASLAYGERGNGAIEPNSTLIFEIESLSIKPPAPAAASVDGAQAVSGDIIKVPSAEDLKKGAKPEVIKLPATNSAAK